MPCVHPSSAYVMKNTTTTTAFSVTSVEAAAAGPLAVSVVHVESAVSVVHVESAVSVVHVESPASAPSSLKKAPAFATPTNPPTAQFSTVKRLLSTIASKTASNGPSKVLSCSPSGMSMPAATFCAGHACQTFANGRPFESQRRTGGKRVLLERATEYDRAADVDEDRRNAGTHRRVDPVVQEGIS